MSAEPSMEDILSSIKRIIAEEGDVSTSARARRAARTAKPDATETGKSQDDEADEVLELSDPVPATPRPDARLTSQGRREQILSEQAAQASRGALESLSKLIVKPEVAGTDTLQGLVEQMLRPMLRDWLDAHLPELVEKMVSREITRITGQSD